MKFPSFDKFLEKVTLNDDVDEDDYLDEDDSDVDLVDRHPSRRLIRRREETDSGSKSAVTSFPQQKRERRSFFGQAVEKPESAYESAPERARSPKVSTFRPRKAVQEDEETNNYSVCVIRPKSMEDALEIAKTLVARCVVIRTWRGLIWTSPRGCLISPPGAPARCREDWTRSVITFSCSHRRTFRSPGSSRRFSPGHLIRMTWETMKIFNAACGQERSHKTAV